MDGHAKSNISVTYSCLAAIEAVTNLTCLNNQEIGALIETAVKSIQAIIEVEGLQHNESSEHSVNFVCLSGLFFACFINYGDICADLLSRGSVEMALEWLTILLSDDRFNIPTVYSVISLGLSCVLINQRLTCIFNEKLEEVCLCNYKVLRKIIREEQAINKAEDSKESNVCYAEEEEEEEKESLEVRP